MTVKTRIHMIQQAKHDVPMLQLEIGFHSFCAKHRKCKLKTPYVKSMQTAHCLGPHMDTTSSFPTCM